MGVIFIDDWIRFIIMSKKSRLSCTHSMFCSLSFNRPLPFKTHLVNLLTSSSQKATSSNFNARAKGVVDVRHWPKPLFVSSVISILPSRLVCTKPKKGVKSKAFHIRHIRPRMRLFLSMPQAFVFPCLIKACDLQRVKESPQSLPLWNDSAPWAVLALERFCTLAKASWACPVLLEVMAFLSAMRAKHCQDRL